MTSLLEIAVILGCVLVFTRYIGAQHLSLCTSMIHNKPCEINCTTTDQLQLIAFYKLPDGVNPIGECFFDECSVQDSNVKYSIAIRDSNTITLLIENLSWDDKGTWQCKYGSSSAESYMGYAKYPDKIDYSGLNNNSEIVAGTNVTVIMSCLYSEIPTTVKLKYMNNEVIVGESPEVNCSKIASECAINEYTSHQCTITIQEEYGVACDNKYSIQLETSVLLNVKRTYSATDGITIKCKSTKTETSERYSPGEIAGIAVGSVGILAAGVAVVIAVKKVITFKDIFNQKCSKGTQDTVM